MDLLNYIHGSLDDPEKNRLIWLHGTAGDGKSAVAFTVVSGTVSTTGALTEFAVEISEVRARELTVLAGSLFERCASNASSPSLVPAFSVITAKIIEDLCAHESDVMIVLPLCAGKSETSRSWVTSQLSDCPRKEDASAKTRGETGDDCTVDME